MTAKLTTLSHKKSGITALNDKELYHLQFSLQAASPETFGYTFVLCGVPDVELHATVSPHVKVCETLSLRNVDCLSGGVQTFWTSCIRCIGMGCSRKAGVSETWASSTEGQEEMGWKNRDAVRIKLQGERRKM
jgi:hypothetical protein